MTRDELLVADVRRAERELHEAQARLLAHRGVPLTSNTQAKRQRVLSERQIFLRNQMKAATPDESVVHTYTVRENKVVHTAIVWNIIDHTNPRASKYRVGNRRMAEQLAAPLRLLGHDIRIVQS